MLRDRGPAQLEIGGQRIDRGGTGAQPIQDRSPRGIGDHPKHVGAGASLFHYR
jgi:hypothetical protein